ncbi:hypothetical protein EYF80_000539 [Liparis tanakae]|uniref:Uncharacterized protein n=1 Tax=Liparis tanakae TaxID=230148 RepID=A0A4Z2JH13_9TELE|nr:hypothetical protein EYF80_000539 [Liparis tanakae]
MKMGMRKKRRREKKEERDDVGDGIEEYGECTKRRRKKISQEWVEDFVFCTPAIVNGLISNVRPQNGV